MDCAQLLYSSPECNRFGKVIVADPTTEARDDPACPGKASRRVRVLLAWGFPLKGGNERFEGRDLLLNEDDGSEKLMRAVALLNQSCHHKRHLS